MTSNVRVELIKNLLINTGCLIFYSYHVQLLGEPKSGKVSRGFLITVWQR